MLVDFVGNKRIINELEKNIKNRDISHAYLFLGSEGVGKFTVAKAFARNILCLKETESCKLADTFEHPDLRIIRSEDSIKKETIDSLIMEAYKMPYESDKKVFIIDGFDEFTVGAQNALLKTLEEPGNYLKVIIIAKNIHKLLPTIISRLRIMRFKDISVEEIENFLINNEQISKKNSYLFSKISMGSVKRALRYANDPSFLLLRDQSLEVLDRLININSVSFREYDFFSKNKEEIEEIFNILGIFLRDIALLKKGVSQEYIVNIDKISILSRQNISSEAAIKTYDELLNTARLLKSNTNFQLTIEVMLAKIGGIE